MPFGFDTSCPLCNLAEKLGYEVKEEEPYYNYNGSRKWVRVVKEQGAE